MPLPQNEIENKIRQLETRVINLEVNNIWKLKQQTEANATVLENIRGALNPILEKEIWDSGYIKNMIDTVERFPEELEQAKHFYAGDIGNLYSLIDVLKDSINQVGINAEEAGKAIQKISQKLQESAPVQDDQENRIPEQKDDLEFFEPNNWLFDDPIKINYENNEEEVWY